MKTKEKNNLIAMGVCSILFLIGNQIAVEKELIDPFLYFIALLGGSGTLLLSIGELFVRKALARLEEMDKEESRENSYTPKL
jgi:hypothetical protein